MDETPDGIEAARAVLDANNLGYYTVPASDVHPHQWFWDSCFVAIGLRHIDIDRAQTEIISLLRGQWHNGMLPHIVFADAGHGRDKNIWNSAINPHSPDATATSGITQPPILAEAVVQIGKKLNKAERRSWYKQVYPALVAYHTWLYAERDPHNEGLTLQFHPWETGLDTSPPWMHEMHEHQLPLWIRALKQLHLSPLARPFVHGPHRIPSTSRMNNIDTLGLLSLQRQLRRKNYDSNSILKHSMFAIEDLAFNCVLIRANQHIRDIASFIRQDLPEELAQHIGKTEQALEQLWDPYSGQYYSRNFTTHTLIKESTIATLLPLYAGTVSADRAKQLVRLLENQHVFGSQFPVASVPLNSPWFSPDTSWQGPTWININWLIIDGLERCGFPDHAKALRQVTVELVRNNGSYEHYNPVTGAPGGADSFSWSAALAIDLDRRS